MFLKGFDCVQLILDEGLLYNMYGWGFMMQLRINVKGVLHVIKIMDADASVLGLKVQRFTILRSFWIYLKFKNQ